MAGALTIPATGADDGMVGRLRDERRRLIRAYAVHVAWFAAMILTASFDRTRVVVAACVWLALVTVPPVIYCSWRVHQTARRIDPRVGTIGLGPMILMTLLLTPFESGLIVPAKNLFASARLLRDPTRREQG